MLKGNVKQTKIRQIKLGWFHSKYMISAGSIPNTGLADIYCVGSIPNRASRYTVQVRYIIGRYILC